MPREICWKCVVTESHEKNRTSGAGKNTKIIPKSISAKLNASAVKNAMI